jgi:hypothetical protein
VLESGDIFFFQRPRIDEPDEVGRFYLVLARRGAFRLFTVGRRRLPEHHADRRWAVNLNGLTGAEPIERELAAKVYSTATRGVRHLPAAEPAGQGLYELRERGKHTELAYTLRDGRQARDVIAVRNPRLSPRGASFPPELMARFGGHRWIPVQTPALLDVEGAEMLLIEAEQRSGVPLLPAQHQLVVPAEALSLPPPPRGRPLAPGSAAELAHTLRGVRFPQDAPALIAHAATNDASDVILGQLRELPARRFVNMADVEKALGAVRNRGAPFTCPYCGDVFDPSTGSGQAGGPLRGSARTRYERHLLAAHPPRAPSAADLESAVKGIHYPRTRDELAQYASEVRHAKAEIVELLRELPERPYQNAADLAVAFGELKKRPA